MFEPSTMLIRYAIMILIGWLVKMGYDYSSLTEPLIGLCIGIFTLIWKYYETKKRKV